MYCDQVAGEFLMDANCVSMDATTHVSVMKDMLSNINVFAVDEKLQSVTNEMFKKEYLRYPNIFQIAAEEMRRCVYKFKSNKALKELVISRRVEIKPEIESIDSSFESLIQELLPNEDAILKEVERFEHMQRRFYPIVHITLSYLKGIPFATILSDQRFVQMDIRTLVHEVVVIRMDAIRDFISRFLLHWLGPLAL